MMVSKKHRELAFSSYKYKNSRAVGSTLSIGRPSAFYRIKNNPPHNSPTIS
jgi:hypothetical protein